MDCGYPSDENSVVTVHIHCTPLYSCTDGDEREMGNITFQPNIQ